jgi:hypothetical protein
MIGSDLPGQNGHRISHHTGKKCRIIHLAQNFSPYPFDCEDLILSVKSCMDSSGPGTKSVQPGAK